MRIGIVGGGITGLVAALEAVLRGHSPVVFEAAAALGGLAASTEIAGVRVDRYYHFICGGDVDLVRLAGELGISDRLHWRPSRTLQIVGRRVYPFGTPLDLLRFDAVSPLGRLRFGWHALACRFRRDWRSLDHLTAREWLIDCLGQEAFDTVWEPLLRLKFGPYAGAIAAPWIWHRLWRVGTSRRRPWSREVMGWLDGGSVPLFDALERRLAEAGVSLRTGTPVERIVMEGGRARGVAVAGRVLEFDRVIASLPLPAFARLLPDEAGELRAAALGVEFLAIACVMLLVDRPLTDAFWVNVNSPGSEISGFIEYTNLDPLPGLGGRALVYVPHYVAPQDPAFCGPDAPLVERTVAALAAVVPGFTPSRVIEARVHRDRHAQPVCPAGFAARIPPVRTAVPGLYLVDATQLYPEDRSRSAMIRIVRENAELLFGQEEP